MVIGGRSGKMSGTQYKNIAVNHQQMLAQKTKSVLGSIGQKDGELKQVIDSNKQLHNGSNGHGLYQTY